MADASITELVKRRSMLIILIAACTSARTAFEAAGNELDAQLCADLSRMIERSEAELAQLSRKIAGLPDLEPGSPALRSLPPR